MMTLPLDGPWQFRLSGAPKADAPNLPALTRWLPAHAPGTVHYLLHEHGLIPDPFDARNELDLQWIDQQDWEWSRTFDADESATTQSRQDLIFDGLDTVATIYLNGQQVGRSVNMFRQVVCDVRSILRPGRNDLRILFQSPTDYAKSQAERGQNRVAPGDWKWQTGEQRLTHRAWIRKTQCHFGWDWGLYLATTGIWQPSRLECATGPRLTALKIIQHHAGAPHDPTSVTLTLLACVFANSPTQGTLAARCADREARLPARIPQGESTLTTTLTIEHPELWWPAGEGAQPLYPLTLTWLDETGEAQSTLSRRIGLRTAELVTDPDKSPDGQPAESFYFKINGRPVVAKGANWIPPDQFVDRCTPEVYRHLLESMVEANMNMVRVWGGGWYEQDIFYDLCDELGLMVWQDFMMACALYPDTPDVLDELTAEARYQVRRLHPRPSLVLWNGDNEDAEAVWRWWRDSPDFKKNVQIYKRVMIALKKTVEAEDTTRRFWLSSPSNNDFNGDCTNPNRGDVHYWTVWHGRQPFSNYYTVKPRFASEFGFQSFPEPRTIRAVVPPEELNPSSRVMEHHQRSPEGNMLITNTMAREMRIPRDFDTFCWVSQINQAMAIRTAVEHWRRLRPWCMGTIYWQLNDLWPVASWSSIDYHGRWKVLQHYAKRFYAPLLASIVHEQDTITAWATNDLPDDLEITGDLEVLTWSGARITREPLTATLRKGTSQSLRGFALQTLLKDKSPHEVCLFLRLRSKTDTGRGVTSENFTPLVPWKWITLPQPEMDIDLRQGKRAIELHVTTDQVIPFFHAELTDLEGHFDNDWPILRPRAKYVLPWHPHTHRGAAVPTLREAKKRLRTFSLYDTYEHHS
jgi:beta-mannosidase